MIYYIEVNLICAAFLGIFLLQMRQNGNDLSADQSVLKRMIWVTILFCLSDMAAGTLRGVSFPGAKGLIELSNLLYMEALVAISILWSVYVRTRLSSGRVVSRLRAVASMLPALLFTAIAVSNPWTHLLFSINADNLYERGPCIFLHWLATWPYFLFPTIRALRLYLREKHASKRREIAPMLYFAIAPALSSVVQMLFYGITSTQVGITFSIALICLSLQNAQVLTDALTGINNRRGLDHYLDDAIHADSEAEYVLAMIDIDNFKSINDTLGHIAGDAALKSVALSLKAACRAMPGRMFLCRFGGDEFVIFGEKPGDTGPARLRDIINAAVEAQTQSGGLPLTVSVGLAWGAVTGADGFSELLSRADQEMYAEKTEKKNSYAL